MPKNGLISTSLPNTADIRAQAKTARPNTRRATRKPVDPTSPDSQADAGRPVRGVEARSAPGHGKDRERHGQGGDRPGDGELGRDR